MHHLESTIRYRHRHAWVKRFMLTTAQEKQRLAEVRQQAEELLAVGQKESMLATIEVLLESTPEEFDILKGELPESYAGWSVGDFIDMKNVMLNPNL